MKHMSSIKRDKSDLFCLIQQDAKNTCEEDVSSIDILENKILTVSYTHLTLPTKDSV